MRRNNLGLILVASLAIGCNAPSAKEVYVDLDAVLAADTLPVPAASDFGAPPSGKAAQTVRMEGREGREFAVKRPQREEDVRELLRESRREARQRIQRELEKLYLLNVENARDRMLRDLEPSRREAFERAMEQVRAIFEPYAQERGRVLAELTSLVGFPDPDPESKIEPTIKGPIMRERFEEAKRLRAELKALEANYNGQVAGLLQGARSRSDELLTEALLRVQEMQAQAVERAESEARQAVSDVEREVDVRLSNRPPAEVPSQGAQTATIPAVPPAAGAPRVAPKSLSLREQREILQKQLDIWLSTNGYTLGDKNDTDMTEEFSRWHAERTVTAR